MSRRTIGRALAGGVLAAVLLSSCVGGAPRRPLFVPPIGFYNYCPSVFQEDDGTRWIYYCTNAAEYTIRDHIAVRQGVRASGSWRWSEESLVLAPSPDGWDSVHVCDPSVVRGSFQGSLGSFRYALFYLGCDTTNSTHNQVGVALAADPRGPWVRSPQNPIARYDPVDRWWGVGQPSAVSIDTAGRILLTYTRGDGDGTRVVAREADLSNLDAPRIGGEREVALTGLREADGSPVILHNAALAYDPSRARYLLVRERHPFDTATPSFISHEIQIAAIPDDQLLSADGNWTVLANVGPDTSGRPRNHNATIATDAYGWLPDPARIEVYYSVSDLGAAHLWTYRIYRAVVPQSATN